MRYLLDTHVWLWSILSPEKFSQRVEGVVTNSSNELVCSAVSLWEISLKYSLDKLDLGPYNPQSINKQIVDALEVKHIPISAHEAISVHNLTASHHRDPFDRMLIWQAIQGDYILITKDKLICQYEDVGLKWLW